MLDIATRTLACGKYRCVCGEGRGEVGDASMPMALHRELADLSKAMYEGICLLQICLNTFSVFWLVFPRTRIKIEMSLLGYSGFYSIND